MSAPSPQRIARALADLFDRSVTTGKAPAPLAASGVAAIATYAADGAPLRVVCACDAALAAYAGAALALFPVAEAEAARKAGLSPRLAENLREVMNVLTPSINADVDGRMHFRGMAAAEAKTAAVAALSKATVRADFLLTIAGYGSGVMSVALTR